MSLSAHWWWWITHSVVSDSLWPHGLPGSSAHGISQARILDWVTISFSEGFSCPRDRIHVSYVAGSLRCMQILYCWATREAALHTEWVSEVAQSCLTLCDPIDYSLPGSSVHGIFPGKSTGVGCHFLPQLCTLSYTKTSLVVYFKCKLSWVSWFCWLWWWFGFLFLINLAALPRVNLDSKIIFYHLPSLYGLVPSIMLSLVSSSVQRGWCLYFAGLQAPQSQKPLLYLGHC